MMMMMTIIITVLLSIIIHTAVVICRAHTENINSFRQRIGFEFKAAKTNKARYAPRQRFQPATHWIFSVMCRRRRRRRRTHTFNLMKRNYLIINGI